MDLIRHYILAITAAAIFCGIVTSLLEGKGSIAALGKLICGVFMAMVVVSPLLHMNLDGWDDWISRLSFDAEAAAEEGENMAEDMRTAIIKERTEAYILDKAEALEVSVQVDVTVKDGIPAEVRLTGDVSPYAKGKLAAYISEELGIPKENQQWNGSP